MIKLSSLIISSCIIIIFKICYSQTFIIDDRINLFVNTTLLSSTTFIDNKGVEDKIYDFNKKLKFSKTYSTPKLSEYNNYKPDQIHLSLGLNETELYVTWSTLKKVFKPSVEYCLLHNLDNIELNIYECESTVFIEKQVNLTEWTAGININNTNQRKHYTYRAKFKNLLPNRDYIYRIVSVYNNNNNDYFIKENRINSNTYKFSTPDLQSNSSRPIKLALFGDLGLINGQSIPRLIELVDNNEFDLIIHNGDFAYDLDRFDGKQGDEFMRLIEPITSRLPYQTSVGNHEIKDKFLHYDQRFTMINSGGNFNSNDKSFGKLNNFFYSFNVGPIHFISISTEFYYFIDYLGIKPLIEQYEWLVEDLSYANREEARVKRPWIVVFGHRPMYCSSNDNDDCTKENNILRTGLPFVGSFNLEKLFYQFGVDVLFWSHEHQYERFLPIYNKQVFSSNETKKINSLKNDCDSDSDSDSENGNGNRDPYFNPKAPVHIISGSAGCEERIDNFRANIAPGSVVRISDYGFTKLSANKERLYFEQISDDNNGNIVDKFTIIKTFNRNFP